jgi:hypothetical protein
MQLSVAGIPRNFIPLPEFRARWALPDEFGITYFEGKDWPVGRLDRTGSELVEIKARLLEAVPPALTTPALLAQPQHLASLFRQGLTQANNRIGLTPEQLDFAVDGLANILQDVVYALVYQQRTRPRQPFDFATIYQQWLDNSVTLFTPVYPYHHADQRWLIRIVAYAYGRIGLEVQVGPENYYVFDPTLACPAWRYMRDLSEAIAQALATALDEA